MNCHLELGKGATSCNSLQSECPCQGQNADMIRWLPMLLRFNHRLAIGFPTRKESTHEEQISSFPLLVALCFTYNETKVAKTIALVKTPTGRDSIALDDKSLSK